MKKNIMTIGYSLLIIAGFFIFNSNSYAQTSECKITSAKFSEITGVSNFFDDNYTNLELLTENCEKGISVYLNAITDRSKHQGFEIEGIPALFYPEAGTGKVLMKFQVAEATCYGDNKDGDNGAGKWGYDCITYISVKSNGNEIFTGNNPVLTPEYVSVESNEESLRNRGVLVGDCFADCAFGGSPWIFEELFNGSTPDVGNCIITKDDISFANVGEFIKDASPTLTINTQGCEGVSLLLSIVEEDDDGLGVFGLDTEIDIDYKNKKGIEVLTLIPNKDVIKLGFKSTEEACDTTSTPNCRIYVRLKYGDNKISTEEFLDDNNNNLVKGVILADCVEIENSRNCEIAGGNWKLNFFDGIRDLEINGVPVNINILDLEQSFDSQSPCYIPVGKGNEENGVDPTEEGYDQNCYELLAPIPGIGSDEGTPGRFSINFSSYQLGQYIQSLFNVALGMLMLLSVIMIIVAGVEYMTVESIFGKSRAKGRITGALTGLILGLGIFIILRTINPQLLEINFGSNVDTVTIAHDDPPKLNPDGSYDTGSEVNFNGTILTSPNRKGGKYLINGVPVTQGTPWPVQGLVSIRDDLKALGITTKNKECTKVGEGCTSMYFEPKIANEIVAKMNKIAFNCNCKITVTGGSEFWLHRTHGVDMPIFDLSINPQLGTTREDITKLNNELSKIDTFPNNNKRYDSENAISLAEKGSAPHWHIYLKDIIE